QLPSPTCIPPVTTAETPMPPPTPLVVPPLVLSPVVFTLLVAPMDPPSVSSGGVRSGSTVLHAIARTTPTTRQPPSTPRERRNTSGSYTRPGLRFNPDDRTTQLSRIESTLATTFDSLGLG